MTDVYELKELTPTGIRHFAALIKRLASEPDIDLNEEMSSPVNFRKRRTGKPFPDAIFSGKREYGDWLVSILKGEERVTSDVGLWSWIALRHFDDICPLDEQGTRTSLTLNRYILDAPRSSYRHLSWQCWWVASSFGMDGQFLLEDPSSTMRPLSYQGGEFVGQLGANQKTAGNAAMVEFAREVFTDPKTGGRLKGVSGQGNTSLRDFVRVSQQLCLTFDLASMSSTELMQLYPERYRALT